MAMAQQIKTGRLADGSIQSCCPFLSILRSTTMGRPYSPGSIAASSGHYLSRYSNVSGICVEKDEDILVDVLDAYSSSNGGAESPNY
jgi:hypothetical protein